MEPKLSSDLSQIYSLSKQQDLLKDGVSVLKHSGLFSYLSIDSNEPKPSPLHTSLALGSHLWLHFAFTASSHGDGLLLAKAFQSQFLACQFHQQHEFLEHIEELSHIGYWHWSVADSKVYYSRQWKAMLGYQEHELGNDFAIWEKLLHPDDRAESERQVAFFFSNPEEDNISEFRLQCKNGNYRTIISKGFVVEQNPNDRSPKTIFGIHIAADELKGPAKDHERLTTQLKQERTLRARAGEIADIGFWEVNIDTGHIYWNRKTRDIHGVSDDYKPSLDTALSFFKEGESRDSITNAFQQCIEHNLSYDIELIIIDINGHEKWVRAIGIKDESSSETRVFGLFQDIDQRKRALHELEAAKESIKTSAERLYLATNSAQIGVWEFDIHTGALFWDKWMYKIYGIAENDFPGDVSVWSSSLHPEDSEATQKALNDAVNGIKPFDCQFRIIRPDGDIRYVKASAIVLRDQHGQAKSMVGVNFDITESQLSNQAQEQARLAAEEANRAKSDFLASMSHELRTPMNGVLGMLQLMESSVKQEVNKRRLQIASNSAKNLLTILDDILDFSRIEAGKLELDYTIFSMDELLHSIADMFTLEVEKKSSVLVINNKLSHDFYKGDQGRIRQMLVNLIGNANKFTDNGEIRISANESPDGNIQLQVEDTGIGIPPHRLKKIFESFTQADNSTTRKYGGSGLGLAICKRLSQIMHGHIEANSEEGIGSRFTLSLPLEKASQREQVSMADVLLPSRQNEGTLNILLVEDNEINQIVLADMLDNISPDMEICNNGQEALDCLQRSTTTYDCILMDCQMPVMDGYEATQKIRSGAAGEHLKNIPIIALTANAMKGDKEKCLAAGMNDYLSKPIDVSTLHNTLAFYFKQD